MINSNDLLKKLRNDPVFNSLLQKVKQDQISDVNSMIEEIVELAVNAGQGMGAISTKIQSDLSNEKTPTVEVTKDA